MNRQGVAALLGGRGIGQRVFVSFVPFSTPAGALRSRVHGVGLRELHISPNPLRSLLKKCSSAGFPLAPSKMSVAAFDVARISSFSRRFISTTSPVRSTSSSTATGGAMSVAQPDVVSTAAPLKWSYSMRFMHWAMAAGIFSCFATVQLAYLSEGDRKDNLIGIHNQVGLAMGALLVARLGLRAVSRLPPEIPGNKLEHLAATMGHGALYLFMAVMPLTGFLSYYLGGAPVNFLGTQINGLADPSKSRMTIAKECFKKHKLIGEFFQYLVMIHIGAAGYHVLRGHHILARMSLLR